VQYRIDGLGPKADPPPSQIATVELVSREALLRCRRWKESFASVRKDHRFYAIVEDTIQPEFDYRYFLIKDAGGTVQDVQPCFLLDQDLLQGIGPRFKPLIDGVRRIWPRFMLMRTLMVGCSAGEGHIDRNGSVGAECMETLAAEILSHAKREKAPLVVLKEFPARYRPLLNCFKRRGFTRVPSLPLTQVNIAFASFEDYMMQVLGPRWRKGLRRSFREAEGSGRITMSPVDDIDAVIDDIYPLYLAVYERSRFNFEKLTKEYFRRLAQSMPDKARFFVWRRDGRIIAFTLVMIQDRDTVYGENLGFDYDVALEIHLYYYLLRDIMTWAMENGYRTFNTGGLSYTLKLHMRARLVPLDLYVRHTDAALNWLLRWALPVLAPVRYEKALRKFPNHDELWA
jgi:hypothetical protein